MKRWSSEAIELLKKQSVQSRRGEPVTPGNSLRVEPDNDQFSITFGKAGGSRRTNTAVVLVKNEQGQAVEMRIRPRRRKRQ